MDIPSNHRQMFERFVYDYFMKKGLHETAEVFLRETGTSVDSLAPTEIDVPDGFLRQWWLIISDHFGEWERNNSQDSECSYRDEGNLLQQSVLTPREHELNEQMIEELTLDNSFGVNLGGNLLIEIVPNPISTISSSVPANQDSSGNEGLDAVVQTYQRTTTIGPNEAGLCVPNPESLMSSFPPINQSGTDHQELDSVVEAFLRSTRISSDENEGKRKTSRDSEDGSADMLGANNNHLETSSPFRDLEHLFELPTCFVYDEEDGKQGSFSQGNKFNPPIYLVEDTNDEEGNFSSKGKTFKLSPSLMEVKEEAGASSIKSDTFELLYLVQGEKNEEEDSSSRDAYMYDSSSHDKGNEDDGVNSTINLDEHHEASKNDESQGVTVGGNLVPKTVLHPESLMWSSAPANSYGTDTLGLHSVVQVILGTTEIASPESGRKRKSLTDSEDGTIDVPCANNNRVKTWSPVPMDSDELSELPSCFGKHEGDGEGGSSSKAKRISLSTSLVKEKKYEEGNFSSKDETLKRSSSFMKEKKHDKGNFTTKHDNSEMLSSLDKGKKTEEGDSSSQDSYMHDSSSHGKGNEDNILISTSDVNEQESPMNDESQGVVIRGKLVPETITSPEILIMSSPPANIDSTDTEGLDCVVLTIPRTPEIATNESGGKRKWLGDLEDGTIDVPSNNSREKTWSPVPMDLDDLSELPSCFSKVKEDGEGDSSRKYKKFNQSTEKRQEEGTFYYKDETFKLTSSVLEEKKDDKGAFSTQIDTLELLSSPVDGKEDDKGDSATRNVHLYGCSHGKVNEDDGVIFSSSSDQHNESPK